MSKKRSPPPSKSSVRVKIYLEMVKKAQTEKGSASSYDFLKMAMNETQKIRMIEYLLNGRLISGDEKTGYVLTKNGELYIELFRNPLIVGQLTQELSRDRIKPW